MTQRIKAKTGFIEDVKPLFTQIDIEHMMRWFDLADWNEARKYSDMILQRLKAKTMPPKQTGGPWSDDKIAIFSNWVDDLCPKFKGQKYFDFFVDLDAHTEYYDVYDADPTGKYMKAISSYMKHIFQDYMEFATYENEPEGQEALDGLKQNLMTGDTKNSLLLTNELMKMLIEKHFSNSNNELDIESYFDAIEKFALDVYPEDIERYNLITDPNDFRKVHSKYHRMDGEQLWFIWAGQNEWSSFIDNNNSEYANIRKLQLAGAIFGVCIDYTFRDDRSAQAKNMAKTKNYKKDQRTLSLLRKRAKRWYNDFDSAKKECHELIQIYTNGNAIT